MERRKKKEEVTTLIDEEKYRGSKHFFIFLSLAFGILLLWLLYKPVVGFNNDDQFPTIVSLTSQRSP